ncbi:hypothetical protein [Amycolatopsis sp. NPDC049868]|uniref:hypothetical protein n=1 Tax=Amycolatopsis sp. NPDC049868 TaxID=3363934 RepID=UPI003793F608
MTYGFGAVFDDLHQTANRITDVVMVVDGLPWNGPSGDYGNSGVQAGWARFIENAKAHVDGLRGKANEHGDLVRTAAGRYQVSDQESEQALSRLGGLLDGFAGGPAGAAIGPAIGGAAGSGIAARLNP